MIGWNQGVDDGSEVISNTGSHSYDNFGLCPTYTCRLGEDLGDSTVRCMTPEFFLNTDSSSYRTWCENVFGKPWPESAESPVEDVQIRGCATPHDGSTGTSAVEEELVDSPDDDPDGDKAGTKGKDPDLGDQGTDSEGEDVNWDKWGTIIGFPSAIVALIGIGYCIYKGCDIEKLK